MTSSRQICKIQRNVSFRPTWKYVQCMKSFIREQETGNPCLLLTRRFGEKRWFLPLTTAWPNRNRFYEPPCNTMRKSGWMWTITSNWQNHELLTAKFKLHKRLWWRSQLWLKVHSQIEIMTIVYVISDHLGPDLNVCKCNQISIRFQ